ncbi:MAG: hypothetical protein OSA81_02550 [Longimicrobiales bacterium]|nr:hypothetical protein [Longimicrobiales bacterium]
MLQLTILGLIQVPTGPLAISTAAQVAEVVIAGAILTLAILSTITFYRVNSIISEVRRAAHQSLGPVSDRARSISDNVDFITQSLRSDVEQLSSSVTALSGRLHLASEQMEDRVEDFNALMEVVQGEAEGVFLDTASTVRGVREGARVISEGAATRTPSPSPCPNDVAQHDADTGTGQGPDHPKDTTHAPTAADSAGDLLGEA